MTSIGTPLTETAYRVMFLGSGELGKEVVIELQRLGVEVIAVDRYADAPAMQVAHHRRVVSMLDAEALSRVIEDERPQLIVPEIEAIATEVLAAAERKGIKVIPNAKATQLTMNREGIRRLAAEELGLRTSDYRFSESREGYLRSVEEVGIPCVVKPIMSSSGKGQSVIRSKSEIDAAWEKAQGEGRAGAGKVIVEQLIPFDYEITLLTVRHVGGTSFCPPIGHLQIDGDYRESWQPHPMERSLLLKCQEIARAVTDALGGSGIFGVELFIRGEEVYFSEVSPRPHDTGLVTLISQELSEFALHARAILGLPVPEIAHYGPSASFALLVEGHSKKVKFSGLDTALAEPGTALRLFGKPEVAGHRRMGVALARAASIEEARAKAARVAAAVRVEL